MIDNKNRKTAKLLRVKCIIQTKSNLYIEQYILPNKFDSQILKKKKQKNKIYDDVLLSSRPSKGLFDTFFFRSLPRTRTIVGESRRYLQFAFVLTF